jgi:cytochrome P450
MPPVARGAVPWVRAGLAMLRNPTEFFAACRRELGDTFVVDAFGFRLFCVFSAAGVRSLYALPEERASFGLATYTLIKHKAPPELFAAIRNTPHRLFGNQEVERYLDALEDAVTCEVEALGARGEVEVFAEMRRLGHRLGFASWAGAEAASPRHLDRLIPLFDRLDSSESFVRPAQAFVTFATRKARERKAMHGIETIIADIWAERQRAGRTQHDFLEQIYASFADVPAPQRDVNAARDIIVLHMGSQSNLYAALAWTFINVLQHPDLLRRIVDGDDPLLEQCANESIRMAQRSITLRQVVKPVDFDDGWGTYRIGPGVMITTMLSVNNTSAAPGLERFDPMHYRGRRLASSVELPAKELVSTFGHGSHSCPAQRFAISAIRISIRRLLEHYEFTPQFSHAEPLPRQIGAVARAARPCIVAYRPRVS